MSSVEDNCNENTVVVLNVITKLVQEIEKKVSAGCLKFKESVELKQLKEKCCDTNVVLSLNAFQGIKYLVERRILSESQTVSMLISMLPSIKQYGALMSMIGNVLLMDLRAQISQNGMYKCPYSKSFQHPFITVLNYNWEKSWFEFYHFVLQLLQMNEDIKIEHKIEFIRPVFRHVFWGSSWRGTQFQQKLFDSIMFELDKKEIMNFSLEILLWQELDINYCLFLQNFFILLLKKNLDDKKNIISGLSPSLALAIKWLIQNGHNPDLWLKILNICLKTDNASGSVVLFILSDVIMDTPAVYINALIDICKFIIMSTSCNKYVVYKFMSVILNWFVSPSFLANPVYKTLEEILLFVNEGVYQWNDQTFKLNDNEYYKAFGNSRKEVKFAVHLILICNDRAENRALILDWLKNLSDSNEYHMQLKMHSFINGILLCEDDTDVISLCLDLLFRLIEREKEISFPLLCLLFYKLKRETNPNLQKIYIFSLPKLSVRKDNIPLIIGIIESLKRGYPKVMKPLIIQLYLLLWKFDKRTYSYLHKMLHDSALSDFSWEINVSKAIALRDICRLDPHLHAKDLVSVLSKILNECSGSVSGLPSAVAIEAVTELCKAYVIDVSGTWNAIQPKLRVDKRPEVIRSLCKFFKEIPSLNSSEKISEDLVKDIVPMLWNYTFCTNSEVVKSALKALSNFPIEKLPLKLIPEIYRENIKLPKDLAKSLNGPEELLNLSFVPAHCWIQFLGKIDEKFLKDAGELVTALVERELTSLPRGIFYLPPEKPEPLSYSYLPPTSICRVLVERLQKHSKENPTNGPAYLKAIIHILSNEYSKLFPPLNWTFLENLMELNEEFSRNCLVLLAKQVAISASAKSILEKYFISVEWNSDKLDEILFTYDLLPHLCKSFSYNILQNFLQQTIELCLQTSLSRNSLYFERILKNLTDLLRNKSVQSGHKNLIAKQLTKISILIPPEHEIMKYFAMCATEFPVKSIEEITSIKDITDIDSDWLRRAVTVIRAIAMRPDINNPLVWLNEFTEAVAHHPDEQNFVLKTIWSIIRNRRACNHRIWLQELTWRIQASVMTSSTIESNRVTLFLINIFITSIIILSGYDCLFVDVNEFLADEIKRLEIFPQALFVLLSSPDWNDMLQKVGSWFQKLSKWKQLPQNQADVFLQALLMLRELRSFKDENESFPLFHLLPLPMI